MSGAAIDTLPAVKRLSFALAFTACTHAAAARHRAGPNSYRADR